MSSISSLATSSVWPDILVVIGSYRPHTMVVGPPAETASFVDALRERLLEPICTLDGASVREFPRHARTIILRNVAALDAQGQKALMDRLESSDGRLQVVTLAERPPFSLVQRGLLPEALYRRLSLIYLTTHDT